MNKIKKAVAVIICVLLSVLSFSSCGKGDKEKKQIYFATCVPFTSMDSCIVSSSSSRAVVNNCMEGLVREDENGEIVCAGAESIEKSSDGKKYTFHLRQDAKWVPTEESMEEMSGVINPDFDKRVTAADYCFAMQRAVDPLTQATDSQYLLPIENAAEILSGKKDKNTLGVVPLNDFTLQITLDHTDDNFLSYLAKPVFFPCNREFFTSCRGRYGLSIDYMICNGPFTMYRWSEGNLVRLDKNEQYTGSKKARVDSVYFMFCDSEQTKAQKIADGNYDVGFITNEYFPLVKDKKGYSFKELESSIREFQFNCKSLPFSNTNMRKAFAGTVDKSRIGSDTTDSIIINRDNNARKPIANKTDENQAMKLFRAGVNENDNIDPNKPIVIVTDLSGEEDAKNQAQLWQKIFGIDVKTLVVDFTSDGEVIDDVEYDIKYISVKLDDVSLRAFFEGFCSDSDNNLSGYKNASYDSLFNRLNSNTTVDEMNELYAELEQRIISDSVLVPMKSEGVNLCLGKGVSGIIAKSEGEIQFASADIQ